VRHFEQSLIGWETKDSLKRGLEINPREGVTPSTLIQNDHQPLKTHQNNWSYSLISDSSRDSQHPMIGLRRKVQPDFFGSPNQGNRDERQLHLVLPGTIWQGCAGLQQLHVPTMESQETHPGDGETVSLKRLERPE
jgi:hypothetical protein